MKHYPAAPTSPKEAERFLGLRIEIMPFRKDNPELATIVMVAKDEGNFVFAMTHRPEGRSRYPTHDGSVGPGFKWKIGKPVRGSYGHYWILWENLAFLDPIPPKFVQLTLF